MNITQLIQTIVLALIQGVTELFPISSLGHTVIVPSLVGWGDLTGGTACGGKSCFLPLVTSLHLGTSIALIVYFWRDWLQVLKTLGNTARTSQDKQRHTRMGYLAHPRWLDPYRSHRDRPERQNTKFVYLATLCGSISCSEWFGAFRW